MKTKLGHVIQNGDIILIGERSKYHFDNNVAFTIRTNSNLCRAYAVTFDGERRYIFETLCTYITFIKNDTTWYKVIKRNFDNQTGSVTFDLEKVTETQFKQLNDEIGNYGY